MVRKGSHMNENNLKQNKDANCIPDTPTLSVEAYLKACMQATEQTDFFVQHGLHAKTIEKYCVGYDADRQLAVFPSSSELRHYFAQSITDEKLVTSSDAEEPAEAIFNRKGLWVSSKQPIFIVNAPLDALSVMQCGGNAICVCGKEGFQQLICAVKEKKPSAPLVLSLNTDNVGKNASKALAKALSEAKIQYISYNVAGEAKNPNTLLVDDSKMLAENIVTAQNEAKKKFKRGLDWVSAYDLQRMVFDPLVWLVSDIVPQGLTVLCAASKSGKSWMALQMCLDVCFGNDFLGHKTNPAGCIYLALEDSYPRVCNRVNMILKGEDAPKNFKIVIHAEGMDGSLLQQVSEMIEDHPDVKLVIIDTFQKIRGIAPKNEFAYATDYREVGALKELADRKKIGILLIHHLRKMPDTDDVFRMINGSTGIMGAADTIFIIYKKRRQDKHATLHMTGRDISDDELTIHFNEQNYIWEVVGSDKEEAEKRKQREYENNPIVQTIRSLCAIPPHSWSGTVTEFLQRMYDVTHTLYPVSPSAIGKAIKNLEADLYQRDHIVHSEKRTSAEKIHSFQPAHPSQLTVDDPK